MNKEMRNEEESTLLSASPVLEPELGNVDTHTYQSIIVTLSDDSKFLFSGPACLFEGDTRTIKHVRFFAPKRLPDGYEFERMKMGDGKEGE